MTEGNALELQVGDIVDERYHISRRLGRGGMGTVYEAQQIKLQRQVALKVLRPEFAEQQSAAKRFEREAKAASSVDHRNVVKILDFGHLSTGELYYTMELLQGQDLSQLLRQSGAIPWSRAGWILLQIVRAFAAIHARGIVHRDIKPANCFLLTPKAGDDMDFIKILDFGIANLQEEGTKATALTGASDILGSVYYMAPEQVEAGHVDARTDVYSFGIMMYELLTGQAPFRDSSMFKVMLAHQQQAPRPPRELTPGIPAEVEAIVLRAVAKAPQDRFQSMAEIEAALAPLVVVPTTLAGVGTTPSMLPPSATFPSPAPEGGRRLLVPIIVAVSIFAGAIALTRWLKQPQQEDEVASSSESEPRSKSDIKADQGDNDGAAAEPEADQSASLLLPPPEKQYNPFDDPFGGPSLRGQMAPSSTAKTIDESETGDAPGEAVPLEDLLPPEPWTLEPGRISGQILDDKGRALRKARICAWLIDPRAPSELRRQPKCTQANRKGHFEIDDVAPSFYDIHAFSRGFLPTSHIETHGSPVAVQPGGAYAEVELTLEVGGAEVRGHVKTRAGEPIAGAKVAVLGPARTLTVSDRSGEFALWTNEGELNVAAWAEGYTDVIVQGRSGQDIAIVLRQHSILFGKVIDEETGEPIATARVRAGNQGSGVDPLVYTNVDGEFRIPGLTEGLYQPTARIDDAFGQASKANKLMEATISPEIVIELHRFEAVLAVPVPVPQQDEGGTTGGDDEDSEGSSSEGGTEEVVAEVEAPKVTNRSLRKALANKLKRCGDNGTIEIRAKYVLDTGRLFQKEVRVTGEAAKNPAVKVCAEKRLAKFKLLRRSEPSDFKALVVQL